MGGGSDSTPQVAYAESEDEYGEDEDAEWQGRSPLYPHVAWERRERRAHVTNLLGGQCCMGAVKSKSEISRLEIS